MNIYCAIDKEEAVIINGKEQIITTKQEIWDKILSIGLENNEKKKNTNVYFKGLKDIYYDIYDCENKEVIYKNNSPFIAQINYNKDRRLMFLDVDSIAKLEYEEIADIVEYRKPNTLMNNREYSVIDKAKLVKGLIEDLRNRNKENGLKVNTIITLGQIAINSFMKKIAKEERKDILTDRFMPRIRGSLNIEDQKLAYKGGRVQAFGIGKEVEGITVIDINSLYPYSSTIVPFPDLKTQKIWFYPDRDRWNGLLSMMGCAKVRLKKVTNKDKIGIVPVNFKYRSDIERIFPNHRDIEVLGVYTNLEIREFEKWGWRVEKIEWIITMDVLKNSPVKEFMLEMYQRRIDSKSKFEKWYYKMIMNNLIGKFGQVNEKKEYVLDKITEKEKYDEIGYTAVNWFPDRDLCVYEKKLGKEYPRWCVPIYSAYVTAYSRLYLYKEMNKIPREELLYCDTDSIMFTGDYLDRFEVSDVLGSWKIEKQGVTGKLWGKKVYALDGEIKMSGLNKEFDDLESFMEGYVQRKVKINIKRTNNINDVGKARIDNINIMEGLMNKIDFANEILNTQIFIDEAIKSKELYLLEDELGIKKKAEDY